MRSQLRLQTCLVSEDGGKRIQSQGRVALLGRRSRRGPLQRRGRAACGPAERLQGRHTLCFHPEEPSSLFYDEDGDLAHEFYEETVVTKNGRKKSKLKRIQKNLTPQGVVKLEHPCIHVDFPMILCEV
ncbi:unnamed protein product, partial [Tetraodon nigroviridis]